MPDTLILQILATASGHLLIDITSTSREQPLTTHRHLIAYYLNKELDWQPNRIANGLQRERTVILHAIKNVENWLENETDVQQAYSDLKDKYLVFESEMRETPQFEQKHDELDLANSLDRLSDVILSLLEKEDIPDDKLAYLSGMRARTKELAILTKAYIS